MHHHGVLSKPDSGPTDHLGVAIHSRICSTRQTVHPGDSLTGFGNVPSATLRHRVDGENGRIPLTDLLGLPTRSVCRTNPVAGSFSATICSAFVLRST